MDSFRSEHGQRGFTLAETMIGIAVFVLIVLYILPMIAKYFREQVYANIAAQTVAVGAQGRRYYDALHDSIAASTTWPVVVTTDQMAAASYPVPTQPNAKGQSYKLVVYKNASGRLMPIVVSYGGEALPWEAVRRIADLVTKAGGAGGYIDDARTTLEPGSGFLFGHQGLKADLANYGGTPGPGHVGDGIYLTYGSQEPGLAPTALQRVNVPDHPEYNQMQTDIDVNGHAVVGADRIATKFLGTNGLDGKSGYPTGFTGGVHSVDMYAEGTVGAGTGGTLMAYVSNNGSVFGQKLTAAGDASVGGYTHITGDGGITWDKWGGGIIQNDPNWLTITNGKSLRLTGQLQAGSVLATGRLATNELIQVGQLVNIDWSCTTNGTAGLASDGSGFAQCLGGVWKRMQGVVNTIQVASPTSSCGSSGNAATATCPANYYVTGGGAVLNAYRPSAAGSQSAPTNNGPSGNGWQVFAGGPTGDSCFVAYAVCGR